MLWLRLVLAAWSATALQPAAAPRCVVVTGGPCSGKTSAIEALPPTTPGGLRVLRVKEAATLYHERGGRLPFAKGQGHRNELWEAWLLELKLSLENGARRRAERDARACGAGFLVVCDRGTLDSRAYCADEGAWRRVLALGGWRERELVERYAGVVHLGAAPDAAYNTDNSARTESCADARRLGDAVRRGWADAAHAAPRPPRFAAVDDVDWDAKLSSCHEAIDALSSFPAAAVRPRLADLALPVDFIVRQADRVAASDDLDAFYGASAAVLRHVQRLRRRAALESAFAVARTAPDAAVAAAWRSSENEAAVAFAR